jgi:hypothetical protein
MTSTPPRLATALLTLLAPGNEALTGDLLEQFQHGKSRSWFWRQVVSTIVLGA